MGQKEDIRELRQAVMQVHRENEALCGILANLQIQITDIHKQLKPAEAKPVFKKKAKKK